jgi:hypothetical protein
VIIALAHFFSVSSDYILGLSEHRTAENQAIALTIPLSDRAINYVKSCPDELKFTINMLFESAHTEELFYALDDFLEAFSLVSNELKRQILYGEYHFSEFNSKPAEETFDLMSTAWKWERVQSLLKAAIEEIDGKGYRNPVSNAGW